MDTQQLQAFDQVVRQGSFSKAARVLDLSQPAITVRIQTIEKEIGGKLFKRRGQQLELTELGRSFLPYARQVLTVLANGIETAQLTMEGKKGVLSVGTIPSLATGFFTSTIEKLRASHPHVGVTIHTGHNQEVIDMLFNGTIKLGFVTHPFFSTDVINLLRIKEPLVAVSSPNHPLLNKAEIDMKDIIEYGNPFIRIDWSPEVKQWQQQFANDKDSELEVPPQTAIDLLQRGIGIALLTETFAHHEISRGNLVKLPVTDMPPMSRESALIKLIRDETLPPAYEAFLHLFQKEVEDYLY